MKIKLLQNFFAVLFLIASFGMHAAPLNGTYTVGSGEIYTSINSAYQDLISEGMSGPVVFNIKPGTYTYNLYFNGVIGASETNTITFQSQSGNAGDVILKSSSSYVLYMSNCSYFTYKNLTFEQIYNYRNIYVNSSSGRIVFDGCVFNGYNTTSTSSSYVNLYLNANHENVVITNSTFNRGSYGVYVPSSSSGIHFEVKNTTINSTTYPLYILGANSVLIEDSELNASGYNGIRISSSYDVTITGNTINSIRSGIQLANISKLNHTSIIANNIVKVEDYYSLNMDNISDIDIYFNTFISDDDGVYMGDILGDFNFKNNLVHSKYCDRLMRLGDILAEGTINNNIYSTSCNNNYNSFESFDNTSNFKTYQSLTKQDQNSFFIRGHNLVNNKPNKGILNNLGVPIAGITQDFNGNTRNTTNPDAGALEFDAIDNKDLAIISIDSPILPNCNDVNDVKVTVRNIGLTKISNFELELYFNNVLTKTVSEGELLVSASRQVSLGPVSLDGIKDSILVKIKEVDGGMDDNQEYDEISIFNVYKAVSGTYTFGENDTLKGLTDFMKSMYLGGICGDVVININDGTYLEDFSFDFIDIIGGSNSTVTIQSTSGDKNKVILKPNSINDDAIVQTSNLKNLVIKNITLNTLEVGCISALYVENFCESIVLSNVIMVGDSTSCENVIDLDDIIGDVTIDNCLIDGGNKAIEAYGFSGHNSINLNNCIFSNSKYGIELGELKNATISNSTLSSDWPECNMVYLEYIEDFKLLNCKMVSSSASGGVYSEDCNSLTYMGNYINLSGEFLDEIISSEGDDKIDIANNTFVSSKNEPNGYVIEVDETYNSTIVNNIFYTSGDFNAIYIEDDFTNWIIDFNNYWIKGNLLNVDGEFFSTLADLKSKSAFGKHSISVDPMFQKTNDYHVCNEALNNAGTFVNGLPFDMDGDARNGSAIDIGADEFTPSSFGDFLVTDEATLCEGTATLVASPGASSYQWSTGETSSAISVSAKGHYSVKVTGLCGADGTDSVYVGDSPIKANFSIHSKFGKNVNFLNWSDGTPNSYLWSFGDGTTSTEKNPTHSYSTFGVFSVSLTVASPCGQSTMEMPVSLFPVSVEEVDTREFKVYPNPTKDYIVISGKEEINENYSVQVMDLVGNTVYVGTLNDMKQSLKLDFSTYANGLYMVKLSNGEETITYKVVKQ